MNSILIAGKDKDAVREKLTTIVNERRLIRQDFLVRKIDDVRHLTKLTSLNTTKKTGFVLEGIDKATLPSLNALLKTIEEPQENVLFILTAPSLSTLPETIVSRCFVVDAKKDPKVARDELLKWGAFVKAGEAEKFAAFAKLDREAAIAAIERLLAACHYLLKKKSMDKEKIAKVVFGGFEAHQALKKNANVTLALTKFVVSSS